MSDIASKVAFALYNSGCLKFGTFKIKSGALSPYDIDLASLLSSPKDLSTIVDVVAEKINGIMKTKNRQVSLHRIERRFNLAKYSMQGKFAMQHAQKRRQDLRSYGRIPGANVARGESILFFNDVITEGLSKLEGIKSLEIHGAHVKNIVVVYG